MNTHSWVIKREEEKSWRASQLFMELMQQLGAIDLVHTIQARDVRLLPVQGALHPKQLTLPSSPCDSLTPFLCLPPQSSTGRYDHSACTRQLINELLNHSQFFTCDVLRVFHNMTGITITLLFSRFFQKSKQLIK